MSGACVFLPRKIPLAKNSGGQNFADDAIALFDIVRLRCTCLAADAFRIEYR